MRVTKKGLAVTMSLALVVSSFSFQPAQAAKKLKLNKTKATIKVGSKVKITVKNAKKKTIAFLHTHRYGLFAYGQTIAAHAPDTKGYRRVRLFVE